MNKFISLGVFILVMFLLQYFFTFLQMNSFKTYFNKFRQKGKVTIGIKKGAIKAGAIVMFSVDDFGNIQNYAYIHGVSVLARFKEASIFTNVNIKDLDKEILEGLRLSKNLSLAILNAKDNFIKVKKVNK
ncbi:MAG: transcriptional regulator GutM [Tissierellia bacterium]|nr:transcriptional regulator GutM [Tissierellia bacterium]